MYNGRPTRAEIDLGAIRHNMLAVKSLLKGNTKFCAVVKADGYGHGAIEVAREAEKAGADYFAVAVLDEGIILRNAGFTQPILVLGYTPEYQHDLVVKHNITQTVFNAEQAQSLAQAAANASATAKVHIKADTGMGRLGLTTPNAVATLAELIKKLPALELEGVFTHFAMADSFDKTYAHKQFELFKEMLKAVEAKGINIPIKHCANSAATLDMPETHMDMVRTGIILYGLWPSAETTHPIELKPAMRFKTAIGQLKTVPAGTCISYGCTYVTKTEETVATLPVGYADGWSRSLSGKGSVFVGGAKAPLAGRVCMDQCIVNVSGIAGLKEGDDVLLFGGPELPAEEIAAHLGTINYEVVCVVGKRVPRVYR